MLEIERKYIIKMPNLASLSDFSGYFSSEIEQIYLESENGVTHRIRARKTQNSVVYTETKKHKIDKMSAIEDEREISAEEFFCLAHKMKVGTKPIKKIRHTFSYKGNTFEIDIYPEWKSTCILETELKCREEQVEFPEILEIVSEVTGEVDYSNAKMAKIFPKERVI